MKTKLFILSLLVSFAGVLFAQDAENELALQFEERVHDFGSIEETGGKVTTTFEFTNVSKAPVTLTNVRASCGCTTPQWSKAPVAPNKKGFINVTFNPSGRPGNFGKAITVTYKVAGEESTHQYVLNIKGKVIAAEKK